MQRGIAGKYWGEHAPPGSIVTFKLNMNVDGESVSPENVLLCVAGFDGSDYYMGERSGSINM